MDIDPSVDMSLSAVFDKTYPAGIHVGPRTYIAFDVRILTHDMTRAVKLHTRIGSDCFIGGRSLILPGVQIGDSCIVGAGSVVSRSVPDNCIVAGNPARILRNGERLLSYGRLPSVAGRQTQEASTTAPMMALPAGPDTADAPVVKRPADAPLAQGTEP